MLVYRKIPSDYLIVFLWVAALLVFSLTPVLEGTFARTMLAIPVVLFIPGYMLVAALFPKNDHLEIIERIALSVGTSIVIVPLLVLVLNFTTGIEPRPILLTLCIYTVAMALIAVYRRRRLPEDERFSVPFNKLRETVNTGLAKSRTDMTLTLLLVFLIAFAAGLIYFVTSTPRVGERFTEFYILDPSGKAQNYPANLTYNSPADFLVGVTNHEYASTNYTVQVALDKNILTYTRFMLNNDETWEKNISIIPGKEGAKMKLEFWLFKENNFTAPYRELQLWVNGVK
jgi:uncharacterized membrane protein